MKRIKFSITKKHFGDYYEPEFDDKYIGDYMVQEWTFGEKEDIVQRASEQSFDSETGKYGFKINNKEYRTLQLLSCLKKAPFRIVEKNIYAIPNSIAELIMDKISEVNETLNDSEEKK